MHLSSHSFEPAAPPPNIPNGTRPSLRIAEPGPRASSPEPQGSTSAGGVTWAATPQCPVGRPGAGSFLERLEQSPRPPVKFAQDLPLRIGAPAPGRRAEACLCTAGGRGVCDAGLGPEEADKCPGPAQPSPLPGFQQTPGLRRPPPPPGWALNAPHLPSLPPPPNAESPLGSEIGGNFRR
ncbi:basic proline-rich protein-like [Physeter macrocephalus]|uniref:Basic proline-rich protein-like n=1 Tax=Physeter macrocephalus TaxID=9755 RepID=A0A455B930_PHYMC|nr:basic proline-rich protein-like [Physeter catodon]|eukprot:XP_028340496.1 basic proline-rich protein-like [Physeter catodon]